MPVVIIDRSSFSLAALTNMWSGTATGGVTQCKTKKPLRRLAAMRIGRYVHSRGSIPSTSPPAALIDLRFETKSKRLKLQSNKQRASEREPEVSCAKSRLGPGLPAGQRFWEK